MIGCLIEDPSPRPFFDFIVLYGSPGKGARRVRKRDWGAVLPVELGRLVGWLDWSSCLVSECFDRVCFGRLSEK
jgi:hypothetical protein